MLTILISTNQPLLVAGFCAALDEDDDEFEVVASIKPGRETVDALAQFDPDVVLVDAGLNEPLALALVRRIRARSAETAVILLAETRDLAYAQAAAILGASGYIVVDLELRDLFAATRLAVRESAYFARGLPALNGVSVARAAGLTKRELAVLRGVARDLSNREIASELWITEETVKFHLTNIYRKAAAANRIEAVRWAAHHGLI